MSNGYIKKSKAIADIKEYANTHTFNSFHKGMIKACEILAQISPEDRPQGEWIPCSARLPEHSYTRKFWLTVKLDDGTITTLIGSWSSFGSINGGEIYDAFCCWKDVMINGGIYRMSQPIPKEQVLAWMPAPEPWKGASK